MATPWTHHTAVVNDFRMHYVMAGSGYRWFFCTAGRRPGLNGVKLFPLWPRILLCWPRTCGD